MLLTLARALLFSPRYYSPPTLQAEGVRRAVPELLRRGFRFVTLEELLSLERGRSPGSSNR